jgi:phosphatidate cytidylyltransferase
MTLGSDFATRVVTGALMAAAAIVATYLGGHVFAAFWGLIAVIAAVEWQRLSRDGSHDARAAMAAAGAGGAIVAFVVGLPGLVVALALAAAIAAVAASARAARLLMAVGPIYAGGPILGVLWLRAAPADGLLAVLVLFGLVWGSDVFAYLAGRLIGGPRLWPRISPKKTWAGLIGGVAGGVACAALVVVVAGRAVTPSLLGVFVVLTLVSAAGDLFESSLKRRFDVKDSSTIIPGHGGVMDRIDGFVAAVAAACLIAAVKGVDPAAVLAGGG